MDLDPIGALSALASPDPRVRFAAEDRLRAAGPGGIEALGRLLSCDPVPDGLRVRAQDLLGCLVREQAVEAFRAAVPDPEAPDLWAGAVAIAAEGHPGLDRGPLDRRLGEIVEGARAAVPGEARLAERVGRLTAYLHDDLGFRGDRGALGDLRSSYLPDVLDRRTGLPIALGVVWMAVAEGLGLPAQGVGLPLHFVARCEGPEGPLFVDAFHGSVLDESGCRRLVAEAAGREVALPPRAFRPLRPGEVLGRMLRNLRAVHEPAGHLHGALSAVDRMLHLAPLDGQLLRDRAVLLARLGRPAAAARALSRALALEPPSAERTRLEGVRRALQREAALLN